MRYLFERTQHSGGGQRLLEEEKEFKAASKPSGTTLAKEVGGYCEERERGMQTVAIRDKRERVREMVRRALLKSERKDRGRWS